MNYSRFLCFAVFLGMSSNMHANPTKKPTKYTLNGCTLTVTIRNSIEKTKKLEEFFVSNKCGPRYMMTENFIIPLSIVAARSKKDLIEYTCPESKQNCISVVKLFSIKEDGPVCDRADGTGNDFEPDPPNTPSESQKQEILSKNDACRTTGDGQAEKSNTSTSANKDTGDFRLIGDSLAAKGEKREIWGNCDNGATFTGSKWVFDNYWTVTAKSTVQDAGLSMDGAVRKACRGN